MSQEYASDLSLILDSMAHAVIVVRENGDIEFANMIAEQLFQVSVNSLISLNLNKFVASDHSIFQILNQVLERHAPINENQVDISSPITGKDKIVDVFAAPLLDSTDKVVLALRPQNMSGMIERQFNSSSAARSVSGLAAMLGHEIKNPLSGIRGAAQLLAQAVEGDDKELTQLITNETDRIVKIVERMEVFSDETPILREPVNLHYVLGHVKKIAQNGFAQNIEIIENYDPSLPDVSGSKDQLIQAFLNLIKNACEAVEGQKGAKVTLSSAFRPGMRLKSQDPTQQADLPLEFKISDNGGGISENLKAHIFEPFVTSKINGSGLGLALVAKIIAKHKGLIECNSDDSGTQFRILLPAWKEIEKREGG